MLLVATTSLHATDGAGQRSSDAAGRTVAILARLARLHELVIVADWPDRGAPTRLLVTALAEALPWHEIVLVATRTDRRARRPGAIRNVPTVRRLIEDGSVVVCLAGGPGQDRTEQVAAALAAALPADRVVRLTGEDPSPAILHAASDMPGQPRLNTARSRGDGVEVVRTGTPALRFAWSPSEAR